MPARRRSIGGTTVQLTELGFGAAAIGNMYEAVDDDTAHATVAAAWDGGIRYFDTAPHYGLGLSERRLGDALRRRPRDAYIISTKVGRLLVPNPAPTGSDLAAGGFAVADDQLRRRDYSRDGVLRSLDESLQRMGLDRVDIVYIHDPEAQLDQAVREAAPALAGLRDQGVIGAFGAGMNQPGPLLDVIERTDLDVVMLAGRWTILDRTGGPLLDRCEQRGVAVVAAAPYNSGLLASDRPVAGARFDYTPASSEVVDRARALALVCRQYEVPLPQAALQFALRHSAVVSVVAGMRTPREVKQQLGWARARTPDELWRAVQGDE